MNVRVRLWAMVLLAGLCGRAAAVPLPDSGRTSELNDEVTQLKDAVSSFSTPDPEVHFKAQDLFNRLPSTKIVVHVNLRGWDRGPAPEQAPASVDRLLETSNKLLAFYNKDVPKPLGQAMDYARGMKRGGQVDFDTAGELNENQMGVYKYIADKAELGLISLNRMISLLAGKVGDAIAFATFIHEAGHARDHQDGRLNPKDVIDGEVLAFQTQYLWLKVADPYDERICFMRTALMNQQRERPTQLGGLALTYLNHLAELQATGGEEREVRKLVEKLGYRDGDSKRGSDGLSS